MKKLIPSYILSFIGAFMLSLYEPINLYATNITDFWFDIYIILKPSFLMFFALFFSSSLFFTLLYFINKKISKDVKLYKAFVVLEIALFTIIYIHGNFLIGSLPSLDGEYIQWNSFVKEKIISMAICIIVAGGFIGATIKFKYDNVIKKFTFIICAIFIMLSTSLISVIVKPDVLNRKNNITVSTTQNINQASSKKNFFILVIDAVDAKALEETMNNSEYKSALDNFTFYPDTMAGYAFTRDSIPFLLSGIWYENDRSFNDYYNNALDNSKLINELINEKYKINMYDDDFHWVGNKTKNISNVVELDKKINNLIYIKQVVKYDLFKYLPYPIKPISKIETMNFDICKIQEEYENYEWDDKIYFDTITNNDLEKIDDYCFNYTHIEGGHVPFNIDKDFNEIKNGNYTNKLEATLHVIDTYINRLKENGIYDNSVIVILADHGFNYNDRGNYQGRQNPALFIKGIDEHHEMKTSDIPVSYEDLQDAYMQLLKGDSSDKLFQNIDVNRKRRFLLYEFKKEDHMVEYEQTGKAWDTSTLIPTGKEFNLKN